MEAFKRAKRKCKDVENKSKWKRNDPPQPVKKSWKAAVQRFEGKRQNVEDEPKRKGENAP
ncbi:MAG: hypothetical protein Fur002_00260 [Anaerolineales bacterium]